MTSRSRDFWEDRYRTATEAGSSLWGADPNGWIADRVAALATQPGLAIDVGAGEGRNAFWLAGRGWRVVATDFAASAVAGMRRRAVEAGAAVDAVEADATTWHSAEPADLAVLCYLQLEPDALADAIARAAESLARGGLLLGIWHDRDDVARGLGGTMTPAIRTTPEETAAAARAAGLEIELSGRRDRDTPAGPACDCLLVARRP
ncbi:class I SAM-dependent methyltransferase [uncultured Amnibacterium sp.]|uniref:class I SAM-dependent methyltransferase n=1 Tax=uncultured Amnibacterium sp. TaxID=1631851 RepID=UPI0035CB9822